MTYYRVGPTENRYTLVRDEQDRGIKQAAEAITRQFGKEAKFIRRAYTILDDETPVSLL